MSIGIRHIGWVSLGLATALLFTACADDTKQSGKPATPAVAEVGKPQTMCPVMGGKIDKNIYADHDGKRIYLCCAACVDTFKKDPEKYMAKLAEQGVTLEEAPAGG